MHGARFYFFFFFHKASLSRALELPPLPHPFKFWFMAWIRPYALRIWHSSRNHFKPSHFMGNFIASPSAFLLRWLINYFSLCFTRIACNMFVFQRGCVRADHKTKLIGPFGGIAYFYRQSAAYIVAIVHWIDFDATAAIWSCCGQFLGNGMAVFKVLCLWVSDKWPFGA